MCWTIVEMIYIPNGISIFYLILGTLQTLSAIMMIRSEPQIR